jgi:hypothetical protein
VGGVDIPFPIKYRWGLRDGVTGPMEPLPKVIHLHMGLCILELLTTSCGACRILKLINISYCFLKMCSDGVECADPRISPRSSHGQWSIGLQRLSQTVYLANIQTPRRRVDLSESTVDQGGNTDLVVTKGIVVDFAIIPRLQSITPTLTQR